MGSSVTATCKCGYTDMFLIGGGMENFETFCAFPAFCKECNCIVATNLLDKQPKCSKCSGTGVVAYDQEELRKEEGSQIVVQWGVKGTLGRRLELTDGWYYCPACGSFDLTFAHGDLLWD